MVSRREVETRANRLRGLISQAVDMLQKGEDEDKVRATLKAIAISNWALSSGALYNYVETALVLAKKQLGLLEA